MIKSVLLLIIAMMSMQFGATVAKKLFPILGAAGTSSARIIFASFILLTVFRPWRTKLTREQWKAVSIYGVALGFMNLLFYFALDRIPLGIAVALEFTGPLAIAVFTSKRKLDYAWIVLAAIGIYLLLPKEETHNVDLFGIILALGAGAFWALYILFGKRASASVPEEIAASLGVTLSSVIVLPFGVAMAGAKLLDPSIIVLGLLVGLLSSALPFTLEMFALKKMPTKTFGILMSLEPAIATLAGILFLNESLTSIQFVAISSIIVSSLGSTLTATKA